MAVTANPSRMAVSPSKKRNKLVLFREVQFREVQFGKVI